MDFIRYLAERHNINLSEQQQKAVVGIDGPILLLAVPGGGKTTVIVSRCANMVLNHGIHPESILTLTFSKASALDMKHRFQKDFGKDIKAALHFSTIHSFCYTVLKSYTNKMRIAFPTIIEGDNAPITKNQLLRQIYQRVNNSYISEDKLEELSNSICYVKNMMLPEEELRVYETDIDNFHEILKNYELFKRQNNYIDYDDMLTKTLHLFHKNRELIHSYQERYRYINVDESQDTSYLQHKIIECLVKPRNNLFMVGDEDQSIYSFRAAFPRALLDFESTYPGARVYLMERNFRSTQSIVDAANAFIQQNNERYEKNMFSEKDQGDRVKYTCVKDQSRQYQHIISQLEEKNSLISTAVLYRNNISAIPLVDELNRSNIPFYLREQKASFFKHWVTTDIVSFMDFSRDGTSLEAFKQIYYKMNAYISRAMLIYVEENQREHANIFDTLIQCPEINKKITQRVLEIKRDLAKLSKLNALDAIEFIIHHLGYGGYLKKQNTENTNSAESLMQIIGVLKSIAAQVGSMEDFKRRLVQLQHIMSNAKFNKEKHSLTLSTIHSSKGLEFDRVYMIDLFDGQFPSANSISEFKIGSKGFMEEEVRLFYVGATRARQSLELITSDILDGKKVKPSRFIEQFMAVYKGKTAKAKSKTSVVTSVLNSKDSINEKELSIGMPVLHKKFGTGSIRFLNPRFDILEIYFEGIGLKTFSLKTCIDKNIITCLDA